MINPLQKNDTYINNWPIKLIFESNRTNAPLLLYRYISIYNRTSLYYYTLINRCYRLILRLLWLVGTVSWLQKIVLFFFYHCEFNCKWDANWVCLDITRLAIPLETWDRLKQMKCLYQQSKKPMVNEIRQFACLSEN